MITRVNISLSTDTLNRLDQLAFETHSSRSKALTDLIWMAKLKNSQVRGQIGIEELSGQRRKAQRVKDHS